MKTVFRDISWFKDVLLPVVVTMLGVYLGILASDWQDQQRERELKQEMLRQIYREAQSNVQSLTNSYQYHLQLKDSLETWRQQQLPDAERIRRGQQLFRGLNPAFLRSAAFTSAIHGGGLQILPYDLFHQTASIYTGQQKLDDMNQILLGKLVDLFTNQGEDTGQAIYQLIQIYIVDIVRSEEMLMKENKALIEKIKDTLGNELNKNEKD
ncbi:hypothetical protein QNI19_00585 [Cytophagaceae bacterium DM2B3-1]|uniref:Uncharacterized protein n=1 Tax=Xanthocytophaga flava TaxID=3048013 RepID=A0ABT7CCL7_9BACT|nr:hypothetical protein [Xanthocytophaga flavus]MDJ1491401.1 hypothetical protein [Xanthocytophaga flavus]